MVVKIISGGKSHTWGPPGLGKQGGIGSMADTMVWGGGVGGWVFQKEKVLIEETSPGYETAKGGPENSF